MIAEGFNQEVIYSKIDRLISCVIATTCSENSYFGSIGEGLDSLTVNESFYKREVPLLSPMRALSLSVQDCFLRYIEKQCCSVVMSVCPPPPRVPNKIMRQAFLLYRISLIDVLNIYCFYTRTASVILFLFVIFFLLF